MLAVSQQQSPHCSLNKLTNLLASNIMPVLYVDQPRLTHEVKVLFDEVYIGKAGI